SSLRAFGEITRDPSPHYLTATELAGLPPRPARASEDSVADSRFGTASSDQTQPHSLDDVASTEKRIGTIDLLDDDLVFTQAETAPQAPARMQAAAAPSEAALREIDALPAERKLAYFV
ncbi:hypothetical protein, partial [Bosea sp. TAB14]|uniref:hypothetical protein n=1 Tax=Bosea sp. TAB14 TaxID=3237481 RepID=UPI003F91D7CC